MKNLTMTEAMMRIRGELEQESRERLWKFLGSKKNLESLSDKMYLTIRDEFTFQDLGKFRIKIVEWIPKKVVV